MPAAIAIPLITGAIGAGTTIYAANKSASANNKSADIAAKSLLDSSSAQTKANDETLAFNRQQAENDYRNQEITRKANYDQYATGQNRLKFLDSAVGLPERQVPDYVASQDPNFMGTPSAGQVLNKPSGSSGDASVPPPPKDLSAALSSANQIAYGGAQKHADPSYWTALWAKDPEYAWKRMLGWQAGVSDAPTSGPYAGQATSTAAPKATAPITTPYSAATYLQQRQNPLPSMLSY